jgi:protein arginine kinase activator
MLCDQCKERDVAVLLTTIEDNAVRQLHLCERCAAERGVETPSAIPKHPMGDFLQAVQQQSVVLQEDAVRCAFCSTSLREFRASGRLGCAHCYGAFERSLRELLRRVHGSAQHVGTAYQPPSPASLQKRSTLIELRDRLRRAVENEQFELAASLRDQIRVLE